VRIGELARRAGVNVETVRYYERRGLLGEPPRTPRGHRTYGDEAVRFLRAVKAGQSLGFALAELVGCGCTTHDDCTCGVAVLARRGVEPRPAPDAPFHLTNGDSAAQTLRRTRLRGPVLAWRDVLHEGPVPPGDAATVRRARARFFAETGWDDERVVLDELERRDRAFLDALGEGREVVLWFEHDLYDQLQLVQALALAVEERVPADSLRLICIDRFEGRPSFAGLGELTEDELASLWIVREPVGPATLAAAVEVWDALRESDPRAVESLSYRRLPGLPFAPAALKRLLEELPAVGDGLGRTERQLLETLADGDATPGELMLAVGAAEEAPFMGDAWVWLRLHELGAGPRPLVKAGTAGRSPQPPPRGDGEAFRNLTFCLTEAGRGVLEGRDDRVAAVEIDRWLGGVHVVGQAPWRWDRAARRVVAP
jgi:hypothetical protein